MVPFYGHIYNRPQVTFKLSKRRVRVHASQEINFSTGKKRGKAAHQSSLSNSKEVGMCVSFYQICNQIAHLVEFYAENWYIAYKCNGLKHLIYNILLRVSIKTWKKHLVINFFSLDINDRALAYWIFILQRSKKIHICHTHNLLTFYYTSANGKREVSVALLVTLPCS